MTCIVSYPTKKAFREAVASQPSKVHIEDPSIIAPFSGRLTDYMGGLRDSCVATNHPKRSWFAEVYFDAKAKLAVR